MRSGAENRRPMSRMARKWRVAAGSAFDAHAAWLRRGNSLLFAGFVLAAGGLLLAGPAFAQEESASPVDSSIGWVFRWLNFAIVFVGIGYLLIKKAGPAFRQNTADIVASIEDSTRLKEEAGRQQREAEAKLETLPQEVTRMQEEVRRETEAERERLRGLARMEAEKIRKAAAEEIAAAERAARMELKWLAARLAVESAEGMLKQRMTPQTESTLFEGFVHELAGGAN
jgi:F-type H+-transporting ATPase subunit b